MGSKLNTMSNQKPAMKLRVQNLERRSCFVCCPLAYYGHGLAMWWNLKIVRLEPQPNKNTKDEGNKQKPNRITSAETAADSDKKPKLTTSYHACTKPHVSGSLFFCCLFIQYFLFVQ